jgi:hypothetical protein
MTSLNHNHRGLVLLPEICPEEEIFNFSCGYNRLYSLENSPEIIIGDFDCCGNTLSNLEGGPKIVKGTYNCEYNSLISLREGPKNTRSFWIASNKLTSMIYSPKNNEQLIFADRNHLLTLDYTHTRVFYSYVWIL